MPNKEDRKMTVEELKDLISSFEPEDVERVRSTVVVERDRRIGAFLEAYRFIDCNTYQREYADIFELVSDWPDAAKVAVDEALCAVLAGDRIGTDSSAILMATINSARELIR
jgi:hypothetical protein